MEKHKISLYHPSYGHFEALGATVTEASKKCLMKIAEALKTKKVPKKEIKTELKYAQTLLKKKLTK